MNLEFAINQLQHNLPVIRSMVAGVADEQARWKPNAESWSILEVINHLYDEEREDFRQRIDYMLHRPDEDWPPIDPAGWVTARKYNERDLTESLANFAEERLNSLKWLPQLAEADWQIARPTPWRASLSAGDLLASWVAHDHLHIRQLNELHYAYIVKQMEPYGVGYAGER